MFAIAAAVIFALALILDLTKANLGDAFTSSTLTLAGLFCIAMHMAGFATSTRVRR